MDSGYDAVSHGNGYGQGQRLGGGGSGDASSLQSCLVLPAAVLLLAAAGAALSTAAVPPLMYGIKLNSLDKTADTEHVYESGRYLVCPWQSFLLFPASLQTIEFTAEPALVPSGLRYEPLHTRTKEGLPLRLQVSLQYSLQKEHVGSLYMEFNQNYAQVFISSIRDILIKAAAEYEASKLWVNRMELGATMQQMVDEALRRTYAECWGLQLMVIELPQTFESSIVRTQVQKQSTAMRENEQKAAQIRAETDVIQAEYDRTVKVTQAEGKANYTLITKTAEATARQKTIDVETEIMHQARDELGLEPANLVHYQKYNALQDMEESSLYFGFESGTQVLVHTPVAGKKDEL